jgi:D-serine deaminase-like pyridoxal phosphate-dependent protein
MIGSESKAELGKSVFDLPTPALVVDLDRVEANLNEMQHLVSNAGRALRPHIKTHKCSTLARMQVASGAIGVTCATLGEAEAMIAGGIRDILIANQIVTSDKLERLAQTRAKAEVKFVVDSPYGIQVAENAAKAFNCIYEVLVEVDVGGARCGAQTPMEAAWLTQRIQNSKYLRFGGIQAYYGGISYIKNLLERDQESRRSDNILRSFLQEVEKVCGIPRVSGAGTGHAANMLKFSTLTEFQSGSYIYSDTTYSELSPEYLPALYVLSTVLSRPTPTMVVMDAGLKALGTEFSTPIVPDYPSLTIDHYSEEHIQWHATPDQGPQIGEKVLIIPSHCCTTVNHHRVCYVIRGRNVVDIWAIDAF